MSGVEIIRHSTYRRSWEEEALTEVIGHSVNKDLFNGKEGITNLANRGRGYNASMGQSGMTNL